MISFIFFASIALIKAFLDTIVFRSGKSIFPASWDPRLTYSTTPLTIGLVRLDPYHIGMYFLQFSIIGAMVTYHPIMGYVDIFILLIIWGLFFELPWRIFHKP
jgi:hypothetical protein